MRRLFGTNPQETQHSSGGSAAKPSLDDAAAKIEVQIQNLDTMIEKADGELRQLVAQGATNQTAKQRALQTMKKKKMYEQRKKSTLLLER